MIAAVQAICVAVLICAPFAVVQAAESSVAGDNVTLPPVLVAVVRGDGKLVPLAVRAPHSERWEAMGGHGHGSDDAELIRITHQLPVQGWTFHPIGMRARPLGIRGKETVPAHCERQEVLSTDIEPETAQARAYPSLGIATHGTAALLPFADVRAQPDDASRRIARLVTQTTQALEADRADEPSSALADIPVEQRARAPVVLERLHRARGEWEDHYYFEAHKAYGEIHAYARGWIVSSRFRSKLIGVLAGVDRGGESARPRSDVLGVIRYGTAAVWVMETRGYEGGGYELVDMSGAGNFTGVSTGGC